MGRAEFNPLPALVPQGGPVNDVGMTDVERRIILELCEQADKAIRMYTQVMQPVYEKQMADAKASQPTKGDFESQKGFVKRFSMPREMYHVLRMVKPDNIPFDQNLDFMTFLKKRYPWFSQFELANRKWEDVANGTSQKGGPLPKAERERLAKENAVVMTADGGMVKSETPA